MDDGKRLAQTPHKPLTFYERIRLEKQQMAALETPLVQGYRLLPEFTPGRAMFWGSIIALWGTAALVMSAARSLDIKTVCPIECDACWHQTAACWPRLHRCIFMCQAFSTLSLLWSVLRYQEVCFLSFAL